MITWFVHHCNFPQSDPYKLRLVRDNGTILIQFDFYKYGYTPGLQTEPLALLPTKQHCLTSSIKINKFPNRMHPCPTVIYMKQTPPHPAPPHPYPIFKEDPSSSCLLNLSQTFFQIQLGYSNVSKESSQNIKMRDHNSPSFQALINFFLYFHF